MNIYVTSESETKLQNMIVNFKNFFVFDVQEFISNYKLDLTKPSNIYLINSEITNTILSASKLKKYQGIIYINKNLSESLYRSLVNKFGKEENIDKFILIDNGNAAKHKDLHDVFEEVFFYERFKKNKIIEYSSMFSEQKQSKKKKEK
jgi:hypothetical protein